MGRGDNRRTKKVVQRAGQRRKKERLKRLAETKKGSRAEGKRKAKSQTVISAS